MSFSDFKLDPQIAAGVSALGYSDPTPIQRQAIPPVLAGRDLIGLAQTGTGKTAAFVLPILQRLLRGPRGRVRALIIAPTRELAEQIHTTIGQLGAQTRLRSVTLYGGVSLPRQTQALRAGVEIVVACPGRLLDHIGQRTVLLSGLEVLVLDEADRMFDMGFLPDVRRILSHLPHQRQTLLFSATMPEDVRRLAHEVLRDPVTVQVDFQKPLATVAHALYPVPAHLKTALLLRLLAEIKSESVLVFTRTKHRARRVAQQLERAGYDAASLQGNLSQNRRQAALAGFREGSFQILVATDIAARGLDVSQITHVINYDIPDTVDAYTHRIGRTGRAARTGDAFTLVTPEDDEMVRAIERALRGRLERRTLPDFDYSAPDDRPPAPPEHARRARQPAAQRPAASPSTGLGRGRQPAPAASRAQRAPRPTPAAQPARPSRPSRSSAGADQSGTAAPRSSRPTAANGRNRPRRRRGS